MAKFNFKKFNEQERVALERARENHPGEFYVEIDFATGQTDGAPNDETKEITQYFAARGLDSEIITLNGPGGGWPSVFVVGTFDKITAWANSAEWKDSIDLGFIKPL
jgi:hypothetical protein